MATCARHRGLGPEPTDGVIPTMPAIAQLILAADRKRRNIDDQLDIELGPRQTPPPTATADEILAAYRKANQK